MFEFLLRVDNHDSDCIGRYYLFLVCNGGQILYLLHHSQNLISVCTGSFSKI